MTAGLNKQRKQPVNGKVENGDAQSRNREEKQTKKSQHSRDLGSSHVTRLPEGVEGEEAVAGEIVTTFNKIY